LPFPEKQGREFTPVASSPRAAWRAASPVVTASRFCSQTCEDLNGLSYFVGRPDDMFVCGGENIFPREVESVLERHPEIHQAAVVLVSDAIKGRRWCFNIRAVSGFWRNCGR
jgi:hypothetical protein